MGISTLAIVVFSGLLATPAFAFTPAEIDQAAQVARQIDIVSTIADDVFLGRDNDTPASTAVQSLLIAELAQIADGLDATQTGDAAYRQSFTAFGTIAVSRMLPSALDNPPRPSGFRTDRTSTIHNNLKHTKPFVSVYKSRVNAVLYGIIQYR